MVILHIAKVEDNPFRGVCVVVPQHIIAHQQIESVGFLNINSTKIERIDNQFFYHKGFKFEELPTPYNNPDIVIFHEAYCIEYIYLYKLLLKQKIPYIIIPHGELNNEAQHNKFMKKKIGNLLLFNNFFNNARAIQCLSQRELESTTFGKKKFIGTNGIDIPEKHKNSFNNDKIKFVYIGRLDPYHKGIDLMIQAIKKQKNILKNNRCTFDLYGPNVNGWYDKLVDMIKENCLEEFVFAHEAITSIEKENVLLDADVFIQTSRFEGMPMGILEAMSYGLPCLVTEGTTLGEIIRNNEVGWVADTDIESISNAIFYAIAEKSEYKKLGDNARRIVESIFSWSMIANNTIKNYADLIITPK